MSRIVARQQRELEKYNLEQRVRMLETRIATLELDLASMRHR